MHLQLSMVAGTADLIQTYQCYRLVHVNAIEMHNRHTIGKMHQIFHSSASTH